MSKIKLTEQEILLVQRIALSGRAVRINEQGENELLKEYNITEARFKSLCRNKIFKRDPQHERHDIVLNVTGENYAKKNFDSGIYQKASSYHDTALYREVCKLSKSELDSAMTAKNYMRNHDAYGGSTGTPELVYVSDETQSYECLEIITDNYKSTHIEQKITWAHSSNMKINIVDIDRNRGGYF